MLIIHSNFFINHSWYDYVIHYGKIDDSVQIGILLHVITELINWCALIRLLYV